MNIIDSLEQIIKKLIESLNRFPYAIFFSTLTTFLLIYVINMEDYYTPESLEIFMKIAMVAALGFPLFLIIKVFFERVENINKFNKLAIRIAAIILLIGYYFLLLDQINMVSATRYIAVSLSLYLLFLVIPYFYKKEIFEIYVVKIFTRLFITFIYSAILFAGLSAILFTINELLNIPIAEIFYPSTGLTIGGIFAPIFLLAKIPKQTENFQLKEYPNIFEILLTYIIMPLISIYTTILYIYFIKILVTQQLPEGLVAHLVIWYSSLSIIILFFISPLKVKRKWIKSFRKWLPLALIPLLLMMFLAMYIRIKAYGITENRYFVVVLGLWVLGIALYYIFSKKKNNILLPLTLSLIMILSVFGPWSSYAVSIYSQNQRFESLLNKYNMVKDNKVVNNQVQIAKDDQEQIQAIIRYFKNNHSLADIKYLPQDFKIENTEELFGFTYQKRYSPEDVNYFSYGLNTNQQAISIGSYDYLLHISNYSREFNIQKANLQIQFDYENKEIIIKEDNNKIFSQSLIPIITALHQKNKEIRKENIDLDHVTYTAQKNDYRFKFIFNTFAGRTKNSEFGKITISKLDFYLLIDDQK